MWSPRSASHPSPGKGGRLARGAPRFLSFRDGWVEAGGRRTGRPRRRVAADGGTSGTLLEFRIFHHSFSSSVSFITHGRPRRRVAADGGTALRFDQPSLRPAFASTSLRFEPADRATFGLRPRRRVAADGGTSGTAGPAGPAATGRVEARGRPRANGGRVEDRAGLFASTSLRFEAKLRSEEASGFEPPSGGSNRSHLRASTHLRAGGGSRPRAARPCSQRRASLSLGRLRLTGSRPKAARRRMTMTAGPKVGSASAGEAEGRGAEREGGLV